MAENLNNFGDNNLIFARSIGPGTILLGTADEELQIGDRVTFDQGENLEYHLRKLTVEEVQLIQNGQIATHHTVNRVERIARARQHADIGDIIEFIIDECCDYVIAQDPYNAVNVFGGLNRINPTPKVHEQDLLYPHECHKCHKKLKYPEAWKEIKKTEISEEKFQHLWGIEEVEFYCCSCYDREMRKQNPYRNPRSYIAYPLEREFGGGDALDSIREAMRTASRRWSMFPISAIESHETIPTVLFPNPLHALQRIARSRFGPPPHFTHSISEGQSVPHRVQEFRVDIRIRGAIQDNLQYIQHRMNIVITAESHERFNGIPVDLVFTMTAPRINTQNLARITAELIFHWISAKVLLHPENEEWIPLELRDDILQSINYFIDRTIRLEGRLEGLIGPDVLERFLDLFPNFPHMWNHNNEACDFCGLSPIEVYEWSPQGMAGRIADYRERILWQGFPAEYQLSPLELNSVNTIQGINNHSLAEVREQLENQIIAGTGIPRDQLFGSPPHEHTWDGDLNCRVCGRAMVDIDAERNRRNVIP